MSTEDQRQRWKAHWQEFHELSSTWQERGYSGPAPSYPALPDDLAGMTCGAVTRAGTPCKQKAICSNGRCKFHGGMATGPTTEAGKEQSRINGRKGGRPRKASAIETEALSQQGAQLLKDVRVSEVTEKTEIMEHQGNTKVHQISECNVRMALGRVQGRAKEIQASNRQESTPEKPKSWMPKEAKVSSLCERCAMFASSGACLAVARGVITRMPTGEDCDAFSAF